MKRVLIWLRDHAWPLCIGLGVLILLAFGRKRGADGLLNRVAVEQDALEAAQQAKLLLAQHKHNDAVAAIKAAHGAQLAQLNEKQAEQARKLEADPVELSKFLVRAGKR